MKDFITPTYLTKEEIKQARKILGLTQAEFARLIGSSKPTVERWESSGKQITGPVVLLITLMLENPELFRRAQLPEKKLPLRLRYMHNQTLCTLIDVDEAKQIVEIVNYSNNMFFRAFGQNEHPSFQDFREFLESRCFPQSRDKMKLILADLQLPFYDPLLIIEKTEGRMAEDNFWIKLER